MSDNCLRVIATDPVWRPDSDVAERAVAVLRQCVPDARDITSTYFGAVSLIDCGANWERTSCPLCEAELSDRWCGSRFDAAWQSRFLDLSVVTPCCQRSVNLNDLRYEWPMGFASWQVEAANPGRSWLSTDELAEMSEALGRPTRQILAHY